MSILRLVGSLEVLLSLLILGCNIYMLARTPWRRSPMGHVLMLMFCAFASVLVMALLGLAFRDQMWFSILRVVDFALIPLVFLSILVLQWQGKKADRAWRRRQNARHRRSDQPTGDRAYGGTEGRSSSSAPLE